MNLRPTQFIVDNQGNRIGVLLGLSEYEQVLAELEELDSIRAYDAAKADNDEAIDFDQAIGQIEREKR